MKNKNPSKRGGSCGCGNNISQQGGGGFSISPTTYLSSSNATHYPLNNFNNDPTMFEQSSRMQGIPLSNSYNTKGGNDILVGGRKRKYKKSRKSRKSKSRRYRNKTKKQTGGINLGYIAQNSLLGHGQYGTWFGAPTQDPPEWNSSLFSKPLSTNTYGFTENNPYLV